MCFCTCCLRHGPTPAASTLVSEATGTGQEDRSGESVPMSMGGLGLGLLWLGLRFGVKDLAENLPEREGHCPGPSVLTFL
jgi:hypothetical protein